MSLHAMPILVLNMGGEMIYILEQRLRAQNIAHDKTKRVLHDVVRTMFDSKFIEELFKPQELYSGHSTRDVFDKLAHSSIMRLSEASMDKLFDLMTMGFKYQLVSCIHPEELIQATQNHLISVIQLVDDLKIKASVQSTLNQLDSFFGDLPVGELVLLRQTLSRFVQDRRVKVSLFLQDGIQNVDGSIILPKKAHLPPNAEMPGTVRYYDSRGQKTTEEKISLEISKDVYPVNVQPRTTLGNNLYIKKAGSSAPAPAAAAAALDAAQNDEPDTPKKTKSYKEVSGGQEMSQLVSLIRSQTPSSTQNFKLNLFPGDAAAASGSGLSGRPSSQLIVFDAAPDRSELDKMVASLGIDDDRGPAKSEGEDLLDLMDSAS
eukprot:TRINITY_DN9110_c0_g1::TRINITY_DN9110_c0_g1_i1::g.18209::m.18209 TRINITY_DN9110_c0_g1::TRINITY_DN9110_c0_g1_i1::g.18209  ORF type:complete len:375 (+),score=55.15,sp/Q29S00/OSCP1_BOVIN/39.18/9e-77,Oscp1/PF10188.4/1.2e-60,Ribosomal_60s/PF00428.14/0.14,Ribosomal_60s/PF00428.14/1.5e+04 TRINITY_DN9110_c0_g1_i1:132-1256(+)